MTDQNLAFPIPNSVLQPYIKAAVSAAICSAMGNGERLVSAAVDAVLNQKVDSEGKPDVYYAKTPYVEFLAQDELRKLVRQTINEMCEQLRPKIKEQIEKQLKQKHPLIAKALVDGLIESLSSKYSVSINFVKAS